MVSTILLNVGLNQVTYLIFCWNVYPVSEVIFAYNGCGLFGYLAEVSPRCHFKDLCHVLHHFLPVISHVHLVQVVRLKCLHNEAGVVVLIISFLSSFSFNWNSFSTCLFFV